MDFNISFPLVRISITKQDRPRAASHAPNLNRIRIEIMSEGLSFDVMRGIAKQSDKIIASSAKRDIRRCFR